jgi:hypothetical protein
MAMTLRLDAVETEALRRQADVDGRSMQEVARLAIREYIGRRAHMARRDAAIDTILRRDAELLGRLAE